MNTSPVSPRVYVVLLAAVAVWSTAYPAITAVIRVYSPIEMATFRMVVGGCFLSLLALVRSSKLRPQPRDIMPIAVCGIIGFASYNLALGFGQQQISAGESSLLVAFAPVLTTLAAAFFLGEKIYRRMAAGIALSTLGMAMMTFSKGGHLSLDWGAVIALYAALTQAVLTIMQKQLLKRYTPLELTCLCLCGAMFVMLPVGWSVFPRVAADPLAETSLLLLYLAIAPLALGYLGWAYVLHHIPASRAVSFTYLIPLGAMLIGYLWLGEVPDAITSIGGVVVLVGVAMVNRKRMA